VKLGVALGWYTHSWETLAELVETAEALGYAAAFVDGDVSMLGGSRKTDVLDGWTVTIALLARTQRIQIGSMRLVHHWNAARLAQAAATAERISPGRLQFLISIGDRPHDERFGLQPPSAGERVVWLDEMLCAVRGLWRGESVSMSGRFVVLDGARIQPPPPAGRIPISIAARRPKLLELVAEHADTWEINLPPLPDRVAEASATLEDACRRRGRDPAEIERSMWIFTRVIRPSDDPACAVDEYRRLNPWFGELSDDECAAAMVVGNAEHCRTRLASIADELELGFPVIDLSGLDAASARLTLEGMAPQKPVDAHS
jgi:alkanesulfonate monooxygenase SsuD/methylene tetrahydromethanopterin reductase-like flavin-dependent oxidoreductase (luciferase family)